MIDHTNHYSPYKDHRQRFLACLLVSCELQFTTALGVKVVPGNKACIVVLAVTFAIVFKGLEGKQYYAPTAVLSRGIKNPICVTIK